MKVLIVSTNSLPASPSGPAYVAGAARQAGHEVRVFESLFSAQPAADLAAAAADFQPDVVGISIRLVFGDTQDPSEPTGTRHADLRPRVREIVEAVKHSSNAFIVLGGPGFNYYARDWLDYLDVDYGIRGEGEESFPLMLRLLADSSDVTRVPGAVFRRDGRIESVSPRKVESWEGAALPAYDLFDMEQYARLGVTPAVFTKRGCAFACTYCPYGKLEGRRYRLKFAARVVEEAQFAAGMTAAHRVIFTDNNFNAPIRHAEKICRALIDAKLDLHWGTGDLKPLGLTEDFLRLMENSGCFYANLAVESASDAMLKRMGRGYTVRQVRQSLEALSRSKVPYGASLMFGAPGETPETVRETLDVMRDYAIPLGVWVTVGVYLWTDLQDVTGEARRTGYLADSDDLFTGKVYVSPALEPGYVLDLAAELRSTPGYTVQINHT